jgi:DNA-binding MarR family transcriptional regulator
VEVQGEDAMTLIMRLAKLQFQYMRLQMDRLDLYPGQPQLLLALKAHEHVSQRELARVLEITPATLTVMLRRMDGKQLISRTGDAQDLRITRLQLTEKGREKVAEIETVIRQTNEKLDALFDAQQLAVIRETIGRVCDHLSEVTQRMQAGHGEERR